MGQYDYMVVQSAAGARVSILNERIETMVGEGWEPILMSGDTTVNVMLRRPKAQPAARQVQAAQAQSTIAAPVARPVAQPTAAPAPAPRPPQQ